MSAWMLSFVDSAAVTVVVVVVATNYTEFHVLSIRFSHREQKSRKRESEVQTVQVILLRTIDSNVNTTTTG